MSALRPCLGSWDLVLLAGAVALSPAVGAAGLAWTELQAAFEQRCFAVRLSSVAGTVTAPALGASPLFPPSPLR